MNKKTIVIACSILAVILGAGAFLVTNPNKSKTNEPVAKKESTSTSVTSDTVPATSATPITTAKPGTYTDYVDGSLTNTPGTKLLFFHAPWCPQCRDLEKDIKAKGVPSGVTIIKVDYDSNQSLRKKYGVTIQTTIVSVDDSGNLVKKYVAYEEPTIDSVIKNLP